MKLPKRTWLGNFFHDDKQVENVIKLLIVIVLLVLIIGIVSSLIFNSESLNVEKNQLIVVVITTVLNAFSNVIFRYFKSGKKADELDENQMSKSDEQSES